jgi:hypothetical protein
MSATSCRLSAVDRLWWSYNIQVRVTMSVTMSSGPKFMIKSQLLSGVGQNNSNVQELL